jgi:hypothetical protein
MSSSSYIKGIMRRTTEIPRGYCNWRYLTQREVRVCRGHDIAATRGWIIWCDTSGAIIIGKRVWAASNFTCEMQRAPYLG